MSNAWAPAKLLWDGHNLVGLERLLGLRIRPCVMSLDWEPMFAADMVKTWGAAGTYEGLKALRYGSGHRIPLGTVGVIAEVRPGPGFVLVFPHQGVSTDYVEHLVIALGRDGMSVERDPFLESAGYCYEVNAPTFRERFEILVPRG